MTTTLAITSSDWHIRTTVPCSRAEADWFEVMRSRVAALTEVWEANGKPPILVAGDLFDNANPPASAVSWAIDNLRHLAPIYTIPGQHDLYGHSMDRLEYAAYGAMMKSGVFHNLLPGKWNYVSGALAVWAMPWGSYALPKKPPKSPNYLPLAVVHKYVWCTSETKHHGAEDDSRVTAITEYAQHFKGVAIGDNHIAWKAGIFLNHGSLFQTTSAQKDHEHLLGIFTSDGEYKIHRFPETAQWHSEVWSPAEASVSSALLSELEALEHDSVAFETLITRAEDKVDARVAEVLREMRREVFAAAKCSG